MKYSDLSKFFGAGVLAASLIVAPLAIPASAQVGTDTEDVEVEEDNDSNWGWLGLLGLLGLAGLAGRKREDTTTAYRDPNVTTRTGSYRE